MHCVELNLEQCGSKQCAAADQYAGSICSVHWLAQQFGDKWSLPVVCRLSAQPLRFSQLKHNLGPISQRMLTRTLKKLEAINVVKRTVSNTVPVQVTYALTERGTALLDPLWQLHTWMRAYTPEMLDNCSNGRKQATTDAEE